MISRIVVVSTALLVGGFCAGDGKQDVKKDDKDQLQGEWVVVSVEVSTLDKSEVLKGKKLVVKGDELTAPSKTDEMPKFKFKLDAGTNPKQIDLTFDAGGKDLTFAGIYKIEGDTFTICRSAAPGGARPMDYKGAPGIFLMVCKRAEKK
jgi:uncharacterized protein (TIGR03067 family)